MWDEGKKRDNEARWGEVRWRFKVSEREGRGVNEREVNEGKGKKWEERGEERGFWGLVKGKQGKGKVNRGSEWKTKRKGEKRGEWRWGEVTGWSEEVRWGEANRSEATLGEGNRRKWEYKKRRGKERRDKEKKMMLITGWSIRSEEASSIRQKNVRSEKYPSPQKGKKSTLPLDEYSSKWHTHYI